MKALLIHHEGAGGGATSRKALVEAIEEGGWKVRHLSRKEADAKAIRSAKADLIVVAGGDGTVAKVLAMLPDRSVPVAIVPTGTANNIARSVGIDGDPEAIVAGWDMDRRRRFDVGNAHCPWGCRPFAEGVGFGLFADSLRMAPNVDGREKLRAGRDAMRRALRNAAPIPLEIALDGKRLPDDLLFAEIMNVRLTGPRLKLAPHADAGDGRLHASGLREGDRAAMRAWLTGKGDVDPPVTQWSGREVVVRGGGVTMRIDDECCWLEPGSEVTIRLEGEPVQLLAPPDRPALAG
jgi:diacylglycerol kinase (ATP)